MKSMLKKSTKGLIMKVKLAEMRLFCSRMTVDRACKLIMCCRGPYIIS